MAEKLKIIPLGLSLIHIFNGMDGKLAPKATATRAQSAAVLQRYCASFGS